MAKWSFINSLNGFTTVPFGTTSLPGPVGGGSLTVISSLYVNGISKVPFGDISGYTVLRNPQSFAGDGNADVLWMGTGSDNVAIIWDERTTEQGLNGPFYDMYEGYPTDAVGNNIRYGLPGGSLGQETESFETILGGDGNDFINLGYNGGTFDYVVGGVATPIAGRAYELNITLDLGVGRDLAVSGEGNDVIYGGNETSGLGDGLWGMGGNDTIYGGRNDNGSDDLYGYAGNDTIYGANGGEVYYGDSGNDVIYGGGSFTADPGNPSLGIGAVTDNTFYGGDGDDLMVANITFSQSREFFFGGNPSTAWVDWRFVENSNGLDNSVNDTVSYQNLTAAGIGIDLETGLGHGTGAGFAALDQFFGIEHIRGSNSALSGDTIIGSSAGNRLEGLAGNDTLDGEGGNDTLLGGDGNDTLVSGYGSDSMAGGIGTDTLTYASALGAVTVSMTSGTGIGDHGAGDTIAGDIEVLVGSNLNDFLTGSTVADTIFGGAGIDTVRGGTGNDSLVGGGNSDWVSYAGAASAVVVNLTNNTATGGDGADSLSGFQNIIGSSNADDLTGDGLGNSILAGDGTDLVSGLAGTDSIFGEGGNDTLFGGADNDFINGGLGADTIGGGGGADTMYGGALNEGNWLSYSTSTGGGVNINLAANTAAGPGTQADGDVIANFDNIFGSALADTLVGHSGANTILGGDGNDTIQGGAGADSLAGEAGSGDWVSYAGSSNGVTVNFLIAGAQGGAGDAAGDILAGFENIIGSSQGDTLIGSGVANTIFGGAGIDTVQGLTGADSMVGGGNGDWLSYNGSDTFGVVVNLATGLGGGNSLGHSFGDSFSGFQHVTGSAFDDILTGDAQNNSLVGNTGIDTIYGGAGIDTLFGGAGNDTVFAGDNGNVDNAVVSGWDGTNNAQINVTVSGTAGQSSDYAFGGSETDTLIITQASARNIYNTPNSNIASFLTGIEIIVAGASADVINLTFNNGVTRTAYTENVTVEAGSGNDVVFSGSGSDLLVGGVRTGLGDANNVDTLFGGQGNDVIYGDDFNVDNTSGGGDTLYGGGGLDTVIGGGGNDVVFDNDGGLLYGGHGADVVVLIGSDGLDDYLASGGFVEIGGSINPNASTDGNDRVFVGGSYNNVQSDLGAGNDWYIASSDPLGSGFKTDVVTGGTGGDVISAWYGDDLLYGDYDPSDTSGNGSEDALWGGAGVDTIFGGPGGDILYGGAGDGDLLIGGDGSDYYYWARTDGIDRIDDQDPVAGGEGDNYILVFSGYDGTGQMPAGTGVFETDQDLYDNAGGDDMVQLVDLDGAGAGTMYRMTILQGAGAGSSIEFDQTEISVIGLWNHDAVGSTPVITAYVWDPIDGRYEYQA